MKKLLKERKYARTNTYNEPVEHVQSHLAITPTEMNQMRERGIPIASNMQDNLFYDGDLDPSVSIDPMLRRGVDINDAWNAQQSAKAKLLNAQKSDIAKYGK